jgi:CHAD domain-containing protein
MSVVESLSSLCSPDALCWTADERPADYPAVQAVLADALHSRYTLTYAGAVELKITHLDTADWRLAGAAVDLAWVPRPATAVAFAPGQPAVAQPTGRVQWPTLVAGLTPGPVQDVVGGPAGIRALLPYARSRAVGYTFSLLNQDAKTVARLTWWTGTVPASPHVVLPSRLVIRELRGYQKDAATAARLLTAGASFTRADRTWLDDLRATPGLGPSVSRRFGMRPDQAADLAVADALLGYLADLEATVDGVVDDLDTEFLHDLRVAVRRTRSVLKLLGDVLPDGLSERMAPEFGWLGRVTTPTRDLDVYLLGVDDMAATFASPADLAPFAAHVRHRRAAARRALVRSLRSKRFADLCSTWRADLGDVVSAGVHRPDTAVDLADQRLHRTFQKVHRRARAIDDQSPAEQVHALRKSCKEMRYLLEVFKPLCRPRAYQQVIADFKALQNVLGEFQDGEVQAAALRVFAQEMIDAGDVPASAILAMGELSGRFDARQRAARAQLSARHSDYLGGRARRHVDRLVIR